MSQSEMRLALRGPRRPGCDGTGSVVRGSKVAQTMHEPDVDILMLSDVVEVTYNDVNVLSFDTLLELVMQCRGNASATIKEIDVLSRFIKAELLNLEACLVPSARRPS